MAYAQPLCCRNSGEFQERRVARVDCDDEVGVADPQLPLAPLSRDEEGIDWIPVGSEIGQVDELLLSDWELVEECVQDGHRGWTRPIVEQIVEIVD